MLSSIQCWLYAGIGVLIFLTLFAGYMYLQLQPAAQQRPVWGSVTG